MAPNLKYLFQETVIACKVVNGYGYPSNQPFKPALHAAESTSRQNLNIDMCNKSVYVYSPLDV